MSTSAVTPAVSPGVANILGMFTTYAAISAATIQQEQADIAAGDHVAAVTDGLTGIGAGLAQAQPAWTGDIEASLGLIKSFLPLIVGLFHHKAKPTQA